MNYLSCQIVFKEIPDEISLSFLIAGCQKRCPGCHSSDSWDPRAGRMLSSELLLSKIQKYSEAISCVLFLGGDWETSELIKFLKLSQRQGFKTALYSGEESVPTELLDHLNYLKLGRYIRSLGGLDSKSSNQKLYKIMGSKMIQMQFNMEVCNDTIK